MIARNLPSPPGRAPGAVLITGLVILLAMTIIAISAMQMTVLEERMAGNLRDRNVAFQAAEAGLQAGLSYVQSCNYDNKRWDLCLVGTVPPNKPNTDCAIPDVLADWLDLDNPAPAEGWAFGDFTGQDEEVAYGDAALPPRVVVAKRWEPPLGEWDPMTERESGYYNVAALGIGTNTRTRVILQGTVYCVCTPDAPGRCQ